MNNRLRKNFIGMLGAGYSGRPGQHNGYELDIHRNLKLVAWFGLQLANANEVIQRGQTHGYLQLTQEQVEI
jgi:hypothetical protein